MTILYAMTALLPFVAIGAFIQVWYYRRQRAHLPTSEWLERMRRLDTGEIVREQQMSGGELQEKLFPATVTA
jgi:hypothetical protein